MHRLPLLTVSDSSVRQRFCRFVAHAQLFEARETFRGHFPGFFAQIQFEVNVRKIQIAKCLMVGVAGGLAGAPRRVELLDSDAVFAAEIMEVRDVVVGLRHQQRHAVLLAQLASLLVAIQRSGKIIQINQTHRQIAEDGGHCFAVFVGHQADVGALVVCDRFFEPVLAVIDVANVDFQPRQAPCIVEPRKDVPRAFGSLKRPVILAKEDQRLNRAAESSRRFILIVQFFVKLESLLVVFDGPGVVPACVQRVCLCPQPESQAFPAPQFPADQDRCFRKMYRFACVNSDPLDNQLRQPLDHLCAHQISVPREKLSPLRIGLELRKLRKELFRRGFLDCCRHQWNPSSCKLRRNRSMHFCRVKPIEPSARPSSAATAA